MNPLVKLCQDLIKINSVTGNEKEILLFIEEMLNKEKIEFQRITLSENRWNIFAVKGNKRPGTLFCGHCDTVPFNDLWTREPFHAEIEGDKLFGLGSSDMKSGLAAIIYAFINTDSDNLNGLLITVGEESGNFDGMKAATKTDLLEDFSEAIVADTSGMEIVVEQSGVFEVEVTITSPARHTRDFYDNINPIHEAAKLITMINDNFSKINLVSKLGNRPILSINQIKGGFANNIVPSQVSFFIDRRVSPLEKLEDVERFFIQCFKEVPNLKWELVEKLPSVNNVDSKLAKKLVSLSKLEVTSSAGVSEIVFLIEKGIDAVFFGPGTKGEAHKSNESIFVKDIIRYNEIIKKIMER